MSVLNKNEFVKWILIIFYIVFIVLAIIFIA